MLVLSVGRMVCATSAVCASWSIIAGFCSFTDGMTLLLKTSVLVHHSKKTVVRSAWKPFFFLLLLSLLLPSPSPIAAIDYGLLTLELDVESFFSALVWFTAFLCSRGVDMSVDARLVA